MANTGFVTFFVILALFVYTNCLDTENKLEDNDNEYDDHYKFLFIFCGIFVVAVTRYVIMNFDISVPTPIFNIFVGLLWGVGMLHCEWMKNMGNVVLKSKDHLQYIFLPIIIFSTSFCMDVQGFLKALPQILIISLPVSILSATVTGMLMRIIISSSWTYLDAMLFGMMFTSIYPAHVLRWLKTSTMQTKYVTALLNGETLISAAFSIFIFKMLLHHYEQWVIHWYQFVTGFARQFLLGIPLGYIFASFGAFMMRYAYNDPINLMVLTVSISYASYFLGNWMSNAGLVANVFCGIMMSMERNSLSKENDQGLYTLWKMITTIMNGTLYLFIGVLCPTFLRNNVQLKNYIIVFVTFLITNLSRFLCFFLFSPILSRIGYGMSFQNMVIIVWGGLKNPVNLNMAIMIHQAYSDYGHNAKADLFFLHNIGVYLLMLLINGSFVPVLLKALGLSDISLSRQMNMNNCMKYIYEARARTITILKMDRFVSDANWPLVLNTTAIKHPYKNINSVGEDENDDEEAFFVGFRFTYCPDCKHNIPTQPTAKEIKEINKEAKLRILKLKKTAYSRHFENGMLSKEGIRIMHQAVEIAMDTEALVIELEGLFKLFKKESVCYRCLRNQVQQLTKTRDKHRKHPRKTWRIWCYRIVNHFVFSIIMYGIILLNMILVVYHFEKNYGDSHYLDASVFFFWFYFVEFWLKVFAYSWIYVYKHGIRTYFNYPWNILEFVILCISFICLIVHFVVSTIPSLVKFNFDYYLQILLNVFLAIRICRLCTFFKSYRCCKKIPDVTLKYLNVKVNKHKSLAFELGKSYITGEEEILDNLENIVDNDQIRESVKKNTENDLLALSRCVGMAEKQSQWVATTVKTKSAMRMVLNSMKDDILELKVAGWIDDVEYNKLIKSLAERYQYINSITSIEPYAPKLIFREVVYMGDDETIINYLYDNVTTKKFDPGDVVFSEGELVEGIYIVITGMLLVTYIPKDDVKEKLKETGCLPVIDHICSSTYEETMYQYIVAGDTMGELATLSDRSYNGVIMTETYSQVFILPRETVKKAIKMDFDPVNGLECRIWKYIGFKKAVSILMNIPAYRSYTQDKIKYIVERSFVPNLSNYKIFIVNEMMQDIILLEGIIVDFNTRDVYTGPCYIPRVVQKIVLPKSSIVNMDVSIESKLMVIPAKDYDEYEIMVNEEQICELVDNESSKCLRHIIQDKEASSSLKAKLLKDKTKGLMDATRHVRSKFGPDDVSAKSRITFVSSSKASKSFKTASKLPSKQSRVTN